MGQNVDVFEPVAPSVNLSVTTTSARVARTLRGTSLGNPNVRIANVGTAIAYIAFGGSSVTATVTEGIAILPSTVENFSIDPVNTHVAAITASGTTSLNITTGLGV